MRFAKNIGTVTDYWIGGRNGNSYVKQSWITKLHAINYTRKPEMLKLYTFKNFKKKILYNVLLMTLFLIILLLKKNNYILCYFSVILFRRN